VQCHLDGDFRQAFHQKVRGAHPHLQRRKRISAVSSPLSHRLRVLIETLLHGFEHVLMLPPRNAPQVHDVGRVEGTHGCHITPGAVTLHVS